MHAATLHKPHVATHTNQAFVDTNVTGTLNLLEEAVVQKVRAFIFTSTTSVYALAVRPGEEEPAVWVTEDLPVAPKNIYGHTKVAAEGLCELFHRRHELACLILRTSRFFPEADDRLEVRQAFEDTNAKGNELLHRRVDLQDATDAHLRAMEQATTLGFGRYIISATTPFAPQDVDALRDSMPDVVRRLHPEYEAFYETRGWKMQKGIGRIYDNARARTDLFWEPTIDFATALARLGRGERPFQARTYEVGIKGYHEEHFGEMPYPVDPREP